MIKNTVEDSKDKGFTLLEVLVSIIILSIIILSFLSFFSQALFFSVKEESNLMGVNIAERIVYTLEKSSTIDLEELIGENDTITITREVAEASENLVIDEDNRLKFIINGKSYYSIVTASNSEEVKDLPLNRIHIKIYEPQENAPNEKLIYETFHYLK